MQVLTKFSALTLLTTLLVLDFTNLVHANDQSSEMRHACVEPKRPVDDQDNVLWQGFLGGVETFRSCVNERVLWHQAQAQQHSAQARETADLWNQFVKSKLNVPADFPHPSASEIERD